LSPCETGDRGGEPYPVIFYSRGKHGSYTGDRACDGSCFLSDFCELATTESLPPMFNAGEPNAPLLRDLTEAGAITSTAGWSEPDLFGYDPWGTDNFGRAGNVAEDLEDPAFLTPSCLL
jgi:hypothetical protein